MLTLQNVALIVFTSFLGLTLGGLAHASLSGDPAPSTCSDMSCWYIAGEEEETVDPVDDPSDEFVCRYDPNWQCNLYFGGEECGHLTCG